MCLCEVCVCEGESERVYMRVNNFFFLNFDKR